MRVTQRQCYLSRAGRCGTGGGRGVGGRGGVTGLWLRGRAYGRFYVKGLDHGRPSVALSTEEEQAVERAMAG